MRRRGWVTIPSVSLVSMMKRFVLFLVAGLVLVGCEKESEPENAPMAASSSPTVAASSDPTVSVSPSPTQSNDTVVVRIDGKDVTRGEILAQGKTVLLLNMNKARKTKIKKREIQALERYCKSAVWKEVAKAGVVRYVHDKGLEVPQDAISRATRKFESQYGARSRKLKRRHNLADLKYMLGKNAFRADDMIKDMALFEVMTNDVVKNANITITDEMVANRLEQIKQANERAAATNNLVFAKATNVWSRIASGELEFEKAAAEFSEDEYIGEGCEWGTFTRDQLDGEDAVLALLPMLKTGDITPPVESDGGVAILRRDEDDSDKTYSFSRIFFRLPYFYDEETPEEARAALKDLKLHEAIQAAIKDSTAKLKVEYPEGTNLVWKITAQDFK